MKPTSVLDTIHQPSDIKKLTPQELPALCREIRRELVSTLSRTGGHLASNLGTVELTVALHRVFESPHDQIVWDVGHQSYTHKLLTGRRDRFSTLRQEGGLSGFPKHQESEHDAFLAGHSSTSISAAYGLVTAKRLQGDDGHVVAVIGDGAFTSGLAYEGMNNAGRSRDNLIIVLNDNEMSISKNVGALAKYLAVIRSKPEYFKVKDFTESTLKKIPVVGEKLRDSISASKSAFKQLLYHSNFFEDFGYVYLGPINGHDVDSLCEVLERAKSRGEGLAHVRFQQGDVGALPFGDGSFDIVLSLNGFHAFPDKEAAWREIFRVLRPGGTFCGCFYVRGQNRRTDWLIRRLYVPKGWFTPPFETAESLRRRLEETFGPAKVRTVQGIASFVCRKAKEKHP